MSVDLPSTLSAEVAAYVETEGGWQVVGPDGPPRPVLAVASAPTAGACVVVTDGVAPAATVAEALGAGALDVIAWPQERERLLAAPLRVVRPQPAGTGPSVLHIAGAGGGVGASTVALAVGGIAAWAGARALVIGTDDLLALAGFGPWEGPGAAQLAALDPTDAAGEVSAVVAPVAGVGGLSVVGGGGPGGLNVTGWPFDVVVAEHRDTAALPSAPGGVLVVADRNTSLRAATAADAPVVLRDRGRVPLPQARRVLGHRLAGVLPESSRVARAGLSGRVPSSLPGSWIAAVRRAVKAASP